MDQVQAKPGKSGQSVEVGHWKWLILLGVYLATLGALGMAVSALRAPSSLVAFGWLLLISGFPQGLHALSVRPHRSFHLDLLNAAFYVVIGMTIAGDPVAGQRELAVLLASFFMVIGVFRTITALVQPLTGRRSVFAGGLIAFYLGMHLWVLWQNVGFRLMGLFISIEIAVTGWSAIARGIGERRFSQEAATTTPDETHP